MTGMFAAWLILTTPQPPVEPNAEALTRSLVETTRALAETLNGVKDEQTAAKVRPRLDELNTELTKLERQFAARPERERVAAEIRRGEHLKKQDDALLRAHDRLFAKQKPAYRALADTALFRRIEKGLEDRATAQARVLETSCRAYFIRSNAWPAALIDLVKPPDGGRAFVVGGEKALSDPWGAPFQFVIREDANGREAPFVWTLSPYGDGKKVLGKAPPADK